MWIAAIITAVIAICELVWVITVRDWSVKAYNRSNYIIMKYKYKKRCSIGADHICTLHLLYFISSLSAKTKQFPSCGSKKKKKKRTWQRMNHMRLKNNRMSLWGFLTSKTGRNQNISAPWTATGLSLTLFIRLCKCVCVCACGLFIEAPRHSFLQCITGIWSVCFYPAPTRWHQSVSISRYNGSSLITALIVEEHQ